MGRCIDAAWARSGSYKDGGPIFYFRSQDAMKAFIHTIDLLVLGADKRIKWNTSFNDFPTDSFHQVDEAEVFDNPYYAAFINLKWAYWRVIQHTEKDINGYTAPTYRNILDFAADDSKIYGITNTKIYRDFVNGHYMKIAVEDSDENANFSYTFRSTVANNILTFLLMIESESKYGMYRDVLETYEKKRIP